MIRESSERAGAAFDEALKLALQWAPIVHFLSETGEIQTWRAQPLVEAPTGSWASIYLAASGYYREATALLRSVMDLVLWEWMVRRTTKDSLRNAPLFFSEAQFSGPRSEDIPKLLELPEAAIYRAAIESVPQCIHLPDNGTGDWEARAVS
ncbi:MAG: hypothetical protein IMX02_06835 [Limnochordaceae bacterium]|nr:hypothetical protein [Limnochordaceae bacterium]